MIASVPRPHTVPHKHTQSSSSGIKTSCATIDKSSYPTGFQIYIEKRQIAYNFFSLPFAWLLHQLDIDSKDFVMEDGYAKTWPKLLLRVEGACILGSTIWAYSRFGQSWWTFAGLLLVPDLGMVGYLANTSAGAAFYNAVHTETPPILLLCTALARENKVMAGLALTWIAHIGMDRMLGYGLKYGTGFSHTHLGKIGGADKKDRETQASS